MNRIVVHSRVGADGFLQLSVPVGLADADRKVQVTIEPAELQPGSGSEQDDWRQFVLETAGAWQGELVRPDQGEYEVRDELSPTPGLATCARKTRSSSSAFPRSGQTISPCARLRWRSFSTARSTAAPACNPGIWH
jgi:hypothetical protein